MIIAGMAVAPATVKVRYMAHGVVNRKWTIKVCRTYRELIMPPGVMSLVSHFGLLANEERGQRSK